MDKKPIILMSILAVVLLVLGSLSNVVGYQSVKTSVNDSPLFQTRTQRAINQQQNSITFHYLGMGKENFLKFPIRNNLIESLKKTIDYISKMDEQTFHWFTKLFIEKIHHDSAFDNVKNEDIESVLEIIRDEPIQIKQYTQSHQYNMQTTDICPLTLYGCLPTMDPWFPGCLIFLLLQWIFGRIIEFAYLLLVILMIIITSVLTIDITFGC